MKNEMNRTYSTHRESERYIQNFSRKTGKEGASLETWRRWENDIKVDLREIVVRIFWIQLA
jgi:hypothetical protein